MRPDIQAYAKYITRSPGYISGQLEVTSACFQRCVLCQSWRERERDVNAVRHMDLKHALSIAYQLSQMSSFEHLTLTGGDPLAWNGLSLFLKHFPRVPRKYKLQMTTTLGAQIDPFLLKQIADTISEVRVSLDAVTESVYRATRGVNVSIDDIFSRMHELINRGVRISTLTTVSSHNIGHLEEILERLDDEFGGEPLFRKATFIPAFYDEGWTETHQSVFDMTRRTTWRFATSFGEALVEKPQHADCWAGKVGFHIKPNGDVYPCCIMGGEATKTERRYMLGNIGESPLQKIYDQTLPLPSPYLTQPETCGKMCLWKQCSINQAASEAEDLTLSIP